MYVVVVVVVDTGHQFVWVSKWWDYGFRTLDIDHSGPRICCLFLCSLLIGPSPPSPHAFWCPASPAVVFHPTSARDNPPTWASPVSVPAYQQIFDLLYLTGHYHRPTPTLIPRPHHSWQIPVAATTTLLPKYLLTWPSGVVWHPPVSTTPCATSPLTLILFPLQISRIFFGSS